MQVLHMKGMVAYWSLLVVQGQCEVLEACRMHVMLLYLYLDGGPT